MKKNKPATSRKKVLQYLIQRLGINKIIALKQMHIDDSEGLFTLQQEIDMALRYNRTPEEIYYRLHWPLSMIKDHAQFCLARNVVYTSYTNGTAKKITRKIYTT